MTGVLAASGVMALSVGRPPLYDAVTRVQSQGGDYGLCGGKSGTGQIQFFPENDEFCSTVFCEDMLQEAVQVSSGRARPKICPSHPPVHITTA